MANKWSRDLAIKDDALHPCTYPGSWEWWYLDADFENGYTIAGTFHYGSPRPPANSDARFIEIAIYDPAGNRRMTRKRYPIDKCSFSTEICDVVIGPNFMKSVNGLEKYHMYMSEGDQGFDLTYERLVTGYVTPGQAQPADCYPPNTPPSWIVIMTKAKVTGTLTFDGKTMKVSGVGYHDHNLESVPYGIVESGASNAGLLGDVGSNLFWSKLYAGDWTVNWVLNRATRRGGYAPAKGTATSKVIVYKGNEIVAVTDNGYAIGSDTTIEGTGVERPRHVKVVFDEPGLIEGTMELNNVRCIEFMDLHSRFKPFQKWYTETYIGHSAYFRHRFDYDANLTIIGQPVKYKGPFWMEHHKYGKGY